MKKKRTTRIRFPAFLLSLSIILIFFPAAPGYSWDLFVSSPWLSTIARFIGGVNVSVKPVQEWNEEGLPFRKIRQRNIPTDSRIVALDASEAASLRLDRKQFSGLFILYGTVPFDRTRADYHFPTRPFSPLLPRESLLPCPSSIRELLLLPEKIIGIPDQARQYCSRW